MEQWNGVLAVSVGAGADGLSQLERLERRLEPLGPVTRCFLNETLARAAGVPTPEEALAALAQRGAAQVLVVPLLLLAGDHWQRLRDTVTLWSSGFRSLGLAGPLVSRESHGRELARILEEAHGPVAKGELVLLLPHGTGVFPQGYRWIQDALPGGMMVLSEQELPRWEGAVGHVRLCPLLMTAGAHFHREVGRIVPRLQELGCETECSGLALACLPRVGDMILERCKHPLFPEAAGGPAAIAMVGTDHTLAPVAIRELFAFTSTGRAQALERLKQEPGVLGAVLLTTCNRTELWIHRAGDSQIPLSRLLCDLKGVSPEAYEPCLQERQGLPAVEYLFRLAAGLNSRILGEDQILAQVKDALGFAREAGTADPVLSALFRDAVSGAKQVKTQLTLSTARASAAELGVEALARQGRIPPGTRCLVIGNGEMGKRASKALLELGADVTVTIRQYHKGQVDVLPQCRQIPYGRRYELLPRCQVVVSATASPNVTITRSELESLGHPGMEQVFLDLAVPRDIQPEVRSLPWVSLYNIDDIALGPDPMLERQLQQARQILQEPLDRFLEWYRIRMLLPRVEGLLKAAARQSQSPQPEHLRKLLFQTGQRHGSRALAHILDLLEEVSGL